MTVVPARVAGVDRVVVASPADRDGVTNPVLLGVAGLLEVDAFVVAGGAQAIGALAYGLPDAGLEPVDRIVGPGNAWVTAAKIEVCGDVGIDLPGRSVRGPRPRRAAGRRSPRGPGPADPGRARPRLPGDPRHDRCGVRGRGRTGGRRPARRRASRRDILARSLAEHGRIVLAPDLDAAIEFVNDYAPEHLSVDIEPLEATVDRLRNAGSLFVGPWAPESAGDYATGANHVLPTGGLARSSGATRGRELRQVRAGPADQPRRARARSPRPSRPWRRRRACSSIAMPSPAASNRPSPPTTPRQPTDEPDARHVHLADRTGLVQLGGDRRGGLGALRRADRAGRPVRPEHLARTTGPGRSRAGGGPLRDAVVRVRPVRLSTARSRPRPTAMASGTDEIIVGAGADEILDIVGKVYLPPGSTPSSRRRATRCTA